MLSNIKTPQAMGICEIALIYGINEKNEAQHKAKKSLLSDSDEYTKRMFKRSEDIRIGVSIGQFDPVSNKQKKQSKNAKLH
jgi:hypothetical protein